MKTIATMFSQGKSAEEIAKKMKLPVDTVKSILGENAPTDADMKRLKKLGMKPQKEDLEEMTLDEILYNKRWMIITC